MSVFFPSFEFQDWVYRSFLTPAAGESNANTGLPVAVRMWAIGKLMISDSPDSGFDSTGSLSLSPGVKLRVTVKVIPGEDDIPATFEAIGMGVDGISKGARYHLTGLAFRGNDGKVESVHGSVRAVRGPDTNPDVELGKMPVGTVGWFVIAKGTLPEPAPGPGGDGE